MKLEDELIKLSLCANTAIQDVHSLTEADQTLTKEDVSALIAKARTCVLVLKDKISEIERNSALADKETEKVALESLVKKWKQELSQSNVMFRRANLSALAAIERQEKAALTDRRELSLGTRKRIVDKQSAAKGSSSITDSLISTNRIMAEHLQRSSETLETLSNSSKGITSTSDELRSMQGHIKNSRSLLTKYGRKEMTDKLFIFLAVVFFLATVLYIMKKRLWSASMGIDSFNPPQENIHDTVVV